MLKRLLVGLVMAFSIFSAHAGIITTSDFFLDFAPGTPENGGLGTMHIRYNHEGVAFGVNIAPFADSLNNVNHGIDNWLTPVAGSGFDFDPIDLYSIWAEDVIFSTSIGLGIATWNGRNITKINFPDGYASWDLTKVDPPAVSSVPEPGSLALLSIGMIGIGAGTIRRKQQKV